jgi:hypothetical protein
VITGFLPEVTLPEQAGRRSGGASEAYREMIELELSRGRNALGIQTWFTYCDYTRINRAIPLDEGVDQYLGMRGNLKSMHVLVKQHTPLQAQLVIGLIPGDRHF